MASTNIKQLMDELSKRFKPDGENGIVDPCVKIEHSLFIRIEIYHEDTGELIGSSRQYVGVRPKETGKYGDIEEQPKRAICDFIAKVIRDKISLIQSILDVMYKAYIIDKRDTLSKQPRISTDNKQEVNGEARKIILDGDDTENVQQESFSEWVERTAKEENEKSREKHEDLPF